MAEKGLIERVTEMRLNGWIVYRDSASIELDKIFDTKKARKDSDQAFKDSLMRARLLHLASFSRQAGVIVGVTSQVYDNAWRRDVEHELGIPLGMATLDHYGPLYSKTGHVRSVELENREMAYFLTEPLLEIFFENA